MKKYPNLKKQIKNENKGEGNLCFQEWEVGGRTRLK